MLNRNEYDRMVSQVADRAWRRGNGPGRMILRQINWLIVLAFVAAMVGLGAILWFAQPSSNQFLAEFSAPGLIGPVTLLFVLVGWIFSLCLHEFGHAATAVLGGDNSLSTVRYLRFNPLDYVNPFISIVLPVVFLLLGGIGLPGGAVYLQRNRLRNSNWNVYVSLAGPLANVIFTLVLILPYQIAFRTEHYFVADAIAVLALFEVFAIILNLLPIPPLDGFHAIQDWLPTSWRYSVWTTGFYGVMILFAILWLNPLGIGDAFNRLMENVTEQAGFLSWPFGLLHLFFWRQ